MLHISLLHIVISCLLLILSSFWCSIVDIICCAYLWNLRFFFFYFYCILCLVLALFLRLCFGSPLRCLIIFLSPFKMHLVLRKWTIQCIPRGRLIKSSLSSSMLKHVKLMPTSSRLDSSTIPISPPNFYRIMLLTCALRMQLLFLIWFLSPMSSLSPPLFMHSQSFINFITHLLLSLGCSPEASSLTIVPSLADRFMALPRILIPLRGILKVYY